MRCRIEEWNSFNFWFTEWLKCHVGRASSAEDLRNIESLLEHYKFEEPPPVEWDVPQQYYPAKNWLKVSIES